MLHRAGRICLSTLSLAVAATLAFSPAAAQAPRVAGLKIVVIEGEGAVNIIQQATAVRSVVEVRDRNDNPVAGATVLFFLSGSRRATFADGARQATLATDAAGRASLPPLTPVSSGSFEIQARATFQGQTATTTIHQSVAAQTGALSSAGAAGGGGAGGGLSALAIGGIVAAAGGGIAGVIVATSDSADSNTGASSGGSANPGGSSSNRLPAISNVFPGTPAALLATDVTFTAVASDVDGDPLAYAWNFGDGSTGQGSPVTHLFTTAGTFQVTVTVSDGKGSTSRTIPIPIKSLSGTWMTTTASGGATKTWTLTLTQTGTSVAGTSFQVMSAPGSGSETTSITGSIGRSSPRIQLFYTASGGLPFRDAQGAPFGTCTQTFQFDPDPDVNVIGGSSSLALPCSGTTGIGFARQ